MEEEIMMRESVLKVLERGKELTTQMRKLIHHHHHHNNGGWCLKGQLDAHSLELFNSFSSALSLLHTYFSGHQNLKSPNYPDPTPHNNNIVKSQDGRGRYKRRRTNQQSLEIQTSNVEDGQAWRKYGQKPIQNSHHPRHYYRCTHKNEQGCQATKLVQLISENPPMYKIIYHGHHTCKDSLQNSAAYFDITHDHQQENSSFFLSFESPNNPKHGLNPFMFPSSSSSSPLGFSMSNARAEQENNPIKGEIALEPSDYHHGSPSTSDLTTVFDDVISLPEIYSSVVSPHLVEEDYNSMMDDSFDFSQVSIDDHDLFRAAWGS